MMGVEGNGTRVDGPSRADWGTISAALRNRSGTVPGRSALSSRRESGSASPSDTGTHKSDAHHGVAGILDLVTELQANGALLLFHDPSGEPYARLSSLLIGGTRTLAVRSREFEQVLLGVSIARQRQAGQRVRGVQQASWVDACRTVAALAVHEGPSRPVFVRVARLENPPRVIVDLGDESGRAVVVTETGWCVVDDPPVAFRRSSSMRSLPIPDPGGDLSRLRKYLHFSDSAYPLVLAWMVNSLAGTVPYVLLVIYGEQGSAKSSGARCIRRLIDPSQSDLRGLSREERDLVIAAHSNYVLGFDNLSRLDARFSDAFCRLSDGSGFGTRRLYADRDEEVFSEPRPILLTGIEPAISAPDLLDRSYLMEAPRIVPSERRSERDLFAEFEQDRPQLFACLLDGVAAGLANLESVTLDQPPRRHDAARFAIAAEPSLGLPPGSTWTALSATRQEATTVATEASPFIEAIIELIEDESPFEGTMKGLLEVLLKRRGDARLPRGWPTNSNAASHALRRGTSILRDHGIDIDRQGPSGKYRDRLCTIGYGLTEPQSEEPV